MHLSAERLPHMQALVANVTARLQPYHYLHNKGLYSTLTLRQLSTELGQLEANIGTVHSQLNNAHTQALTKEVNLPFVYRR